MGKKEREKEEEDKHVDGKKEGEREKEEDFVHLEQQRKGQNKRNFCC